MLYTPSPEAAYYPRQYSYSPRYHRSDMHPSYPTSSSSSSHRARPQPPVRRSRTLGTPYVPDHTAAYDFEYEYEYEYVDPSDTDGYARMPHTYAWVLEQQIAEMVKANDETVRWVYRQQERDTLREQVAYRILASGRKGYPAWEELFVHHPAARARWAAAPVGEAGGRRERWEAEAEETIGDELRRLQEYRRQTERQRAAYERRKRAEEEKERARMEREREEMKRRRKEAERDAGGRYEARWAALLSSSGTLGFRDIPWPMFSQPRSLEGVTPSKVASFVLSPMHPGETRREKIRNALKRWHPDRFGRLWSRVEESERETIEEAVGVVARCLNDLLERDSKQ